MIWASVNDRKWNPVPLSIRGPFVSHLMFTDDMVLFVEALIEQLSIIMQILNCFSLAFGQRINFSKSSLYVSPNVDTSLTNSLVSMFRMVKVDNLGRYLGSLRFLQELLIIRIKRFWIR